jgi:hypothetical protein
VPVESERQQPVNVVATARPQVAHEFAGDGTRALRRNPSNGSVGRFKLCAMRRGSSGTSMGGRLVATRKRKRKPRVVSAEAMRRDEDRNGELLKKKFGRPMA